MKSTEEIMEAMIKDSESYGDECSRELAGLDERIKAAMILLARSAFQRGFIAGLKQSSE